MNSTPEINNAQYLQWLEELLHEGKNINVHVNGMSMFPWLMPKDVVCVQPTERRLLTLGRVIVFKGAEGWVAHRIIRANSAKNEFVTRGDANLHKDLPLKQEDIKGVVIGVPQQKFFWSNWAVCKSGPFLAKTGSYTAPLFWVTARGAVWLWKWIKRVKSMK